MILMAVRPRSTGWSYAAAISWRVVAHRYSFVVFLAAALALLIVGRVQPRAVEGARAHAIDTLAPVMDAIARPMNLAGNLITDARNYVSLRAENERLRAANAQLKDWQNAAANLQKENHDLRDLLRFKTEPSLAYISARVIADTGGAFARGLIVTAGKLDGVREGMAAMTGDGLIGRVVEAGDWSSRVVLITDLNSRIPVTVAGSEERAILAGDNSSAPKLLFLPQDAILTPGASVVTSGHGGVFPPNLPVGTVVEGAHGAYSLAPAADLGRINYVRLVDFNLQGGAFNPLAAKVDAETKTKKH
jgi:rod shape-determining protein MreC